MFLRSGILAANKYQTGFDQSKFAAMHVSKKLRGVNAVQTFLFGFEKSRYQKREALIGLIISPMYDRMKIRKLEKTEK